MVTIFYPMGDYTAADIAIKLQALASIQEQSIYVIPKHFGRDDNKVLQRLKKTDVALFVIFDVRKIDETTYDEFKILKEKNIPIYAFVPEGVEMPDFKIKIYKYVLNDKQDLSRKLSVFIENLKSADIVKKTEWTDLLIAIGTIAGGLLLLNGLLKK